MDNSTDNHINVTVIVAVYNTQQFLRECLDSLVVQTLKNIEIIIINDCSTDASSAIINEYVDKYDYIKVVHNSVNIKLGPTRNRGVSLAHGKYLYFLDSDDYLLPNGLELLYTASQKDNIDMDIVIGNYVIFEHRDKPMNQHTLNMIEESNFSKFAIPLYAWGRLFRRDFWISNKFTFEPVYAEDLMLIPIVMDCAKHINVINDNICVYRSNPDSLTHSYHSYTELMYVLQNLYAYFCGLASIFSVTILEINKLLPCKMNRFKTRHLR